MQPIDNILSSGVLPSLFLALTSAPRETSRLAQVYSLTSLSLQQHHRSWLQCRCLPVRSRDVSSFSNSLEAPASEKRRLLNFVVSNSTWRDGELSVTYRQPFDLLAVTATTEAEVKTAGGSSGDFFIKGGVP